MVKILRKLRFVLYPLAFLLMFIIGTYFTFPKSVLKEMSESSLTYAALNLGPKDRGLVQVSMADVSLWRLSGMKVKDLKFAWPGTKLQPPMNIELNSLEGRLGIFAMLSGSRSVHAQSSFYDGDLDLYVGMRKKNILRSIDLDISKVNLGKMAFLGPWLGAAMEGIINMNIDLVATSELSKDGQGTIKLNFESLSYGPGSVALPVSGFVSSISVPKINLGKLTADLSLDKGELTSKTFTLEGGDIEADLKLTMAMGERPDLSRIEGRGWFSVKQELLKTNETLKMLYDLIPELKQAEQNGGRVGFTMAGSIVRPQFRLEAYQGE